MDKVRLGIAGLGNMGALHAATVRAGKIRRLELGAVCDADAARLNQFAGIPGFTSADAMISSGIIDAMLIATPHYSHTTVGIKALEAGLHLLVEKPISVHKADCERLIAAHRDERQVFAAMFNQRTDPAYARIRTLVQDGGLGEIRRINWIITNWFRTAAYYASSGWRATWAGEGGGVLLNQCPHNLDLLQWMFGLPARVRAFCQFGRYHDIEVEDDVTAYLEFANGATGVFIASTGEAPGTSRLEVAAEGGRVVYERDELHIARNAVPMSEFSRTATQAFAQPECVDTVVRLSDHGGQHTEILQNFTEAILDGRPLIAPASEGIRSVELANAMLLSTWLDRAVELPLDGARFARLLRQHARRSVGPRRVPAPTVADDFAKSFNR
ncbi:MAG TPA: Gfo/Idh/MocA family oxidoreductase [Opitutaceae bacterium]|nr:Gfo/Idh/MocA family oxidoreductase [Opitutaceae bacterium]